MIDKKGYRLNVGIILANANGQLWVGQRTGLSNAWQFPQGGINQGESTRQAMYRELQEELGLQSVDVAILGETAGWLRYQLPVHLRRYHSHPLCIGQIQKWFLLRLMSEESSICLEASSHPEFSAWRWVDYWQPYEWVVDFKRAVYQAALTEFAPLLVC